MRLRGLSDVARITPTKFRLGNACYVIFMISTRQTVCGEIPSKECHSHLPTWSTADLDFGTRGRAERSTIDERDSASGEN